MTTREEVRSQTAIETTRLETQAAVDIANIEAFALVESTRLMADAAKVQAQEQRQAVQVWANVLPLLMLLVVGGGAVWLFVVYHGRMMLVLADKGIFFPYRISIAQGWQQPSNQTPDMSQTMSGTDHEEVLRGYANTYNLHVRVENGYYLLVDRTTQQVVKQLALRDA